MIGGNFEKFKMNEHFLKFTAVFCFILRFGVWPRYESSQYQLNRFTGCHVPLEIGRQGSKRVTTAVGDCALSRTTRGDAPTKLT